MVKSLTLLGIETSCDETAAAVVMRDSEGNGRIIAQRVLSQLADHVPFGGVVPEIAARQHILHLDRLIEDTLVESGLKLSNLDAIAATAGPGLLGGIIVGLSTAKALALASGKPLIAVNHLEGHALTPGLTDGLKPPYLLLLVSGGHTQILAIEEVGKYHRYGTTMDDALGEAFDKVAKLLGGPYPGGPHVERLAQNGKSNIYNLPRPLGGKPGCNFSFSGLKTAVRLLVEAQNELTDQIKQDMAAAFQQAVSDTLCDRLKNAMTRFELEHDGRLQHTLVIAGGVAANQFIRGRLQTLSEYRNWKLSLPPLALCTDNAAMIAWAGAEKFAIGQADRLDVAARARWPLDPAAEAVIGAGVKA